MLVCLQSLGFEGREREKVQGRLAAWDQRGGLPLQVLRRKLSEDVLLCTEFIVLPCCYQMVTKTKKRANLVLRTTFRKDGRASVPPMPYVSAIISRTVKFRPHIDSNYQACWERVQNLTFPFTMNKRRAVRLCSVHFLSAQTDLCRNEVHQIPDHL
jgi:hypothetical protein